MGYTQHLRAVCTFHVRGATDMYPGTALTVLTVLTVLTEMLRDLMQITPVKHIQTFNLQSHGI